MDVESLGYTFDPADLAEGSLLGSREVEAQLDATTNLVSAWSASDDVFFCGPVRFAFTALLQARDAIHPEPLAPLVTRFYPDRQETIYGTEGLILTLSAFVPIATGYGRSVGWLVEVQAEGPRLLQVDLDVRFAGAGRDPHQERLVRVTQDRGQVVGTSEPIHLSQFGVTLGSPNEVRVFGSPTGPPDHVEVSEPARARLTYRLLAEGTIEVPFTLTYSPAGEQMAWSGFLGLADLDRFASKSRANLEGFLGRPQIVTPEGRVNRALGWSGATALRVQHSFRVGAGVPSVPMRSEIPVGAAAWYAIGNDWLSPQFSGELLQTLAQKAQAENGLIASVLQGRTGAREDFGLAISDATPLFILAVAHHLAVTGESDRSLELWPAVRRAADGLLGARADDGLIHFAPAATGPRGLPGWRKEIPGYQLEGALPELNALAAWALFAAHSLALRRGETKVGERWRDAAGELAAALPRLARSGGSLPRLADDQDALTGDLVFPLLAGFGPEPLAAGLARRLASAYQWTEAGARTVGSDQPGYDPEFAGGLMGGISPILTAWVGVAAREHFPGLPVEALRGLASLIENERPNARDLVPGQLPAALHGETFGRLGPSLHPLAAPLMRWLAIEGVLGLRLPLVPWVKSITIQPALPENWSWLVVSRLPWQGSEVSAIVHDGTIHTNGEFEAARIERWARIEPVPGTAVPAWRLQRRGERRLFVAAPDEAYSGTLVAAGSRWRVRLAGGEAALLSEPE